MNPINSLLKGTQRPQNNMLSQVSTIKSLLAGKDANAVFNSMMYSNPSFKRFVEDNKGKTPDEIANAYGIDIGTVMNLLK